MSDSETLPFSDSLGPQLKKKFIRQKTQCKRKGGPSCSFAPKAFFENKFEHTFSRPLVVTQAGRAKSRLERGSQIPSGRRAVGASSSSAREGNPGALSLVPLKCHSEISLGSWAFMSTRTLPAEVPLHKATCTRGQQVKIKHKL